MKFYNSKTLVTYVLRFLSLKFSIANYKLVKTTNESYHHIINHIVAVNENVAKACLIITLEMFVENKIIIETQADQIEFKIIL